jgi:hypothetical protein
MIESCLLKGLLMTKLEKRLCLLAIVFVLVYLGAAAMTLHNRSRDDQAAQLRIESNLPTKSESRLAMAELFLPMVVLLTLSVSYIVVKKKRARQRAALDETLDQTAAPEYSNVPHHDPSTHSAASP